MEGMELLNFQIISQVGDAKSFLHEALKASRNENFNEAEKYIKKAEESLARAHELHMQLIQQEAQGNQVHVSILLMHAEDQMMTTELLRDFANEMLLTHKKYSKKQGS